MKERKRERKSIKKISKRYGRQAKKKKNGGLGLIEDISKRLLKIDIRKEHRRETT